MEFDRTDYDEVPVLYCRHCLSLRVKSMDEEHDEDFLEYCDECGSTDIDETDIHTWGKMYEQKYKRNFLTGEETDGRAEEK